MRQNGRRGFKCALGAIRGYKEKRQWDLGRSNLRPKKGTTTGKCFFERFFSKRSLKKGWVRLVGKRDTTRYIFSTKSQRGKGGLFHSRLNISWRDSEKKSVSWKKGERQMHSHAFFQDERVRRVILCPRAERKKERRQL